MAGLRIFRWETSPLPWRLMLGELTGDREPRTHLALVPAQSAAEWSDPDVRPVRWTDVVLVAVEDPAGLAGLRAGDFLAAGNERQRSEST